jgi:septal ring factor EnvC (AmiA/AmiB activator)
VSTRCVKSRTGAPEPSGAGRGEPKTDDGAMKPRPDYATRIAVTATLIGLGIAYWLGAERASEARFAAEGVRRHEAKLEEHERRLTADEKVLAAHGAAIEGLKADAGSLRAAVDGARADDAALKAEIAKLRAEVDALRSEAARRDDALAKLLERVARLEALKSARMQ